MIDVLITQKGYKCERCSHEWLPQAKKIKIPIVCPKCHSAYWNIPKNERKNDKSKIVETN